MIPLSNESPDSTLAEAIIPIRLSVYLHPLALLSISSKSFITPW